MTLLERMQREVEHSFVTRGQNGGSIGTAHSSSAKVAAGAEDQSCTEHRCLQEPLKLTPAGAMLFWLSSPDNQQDQQQPIGAGAAFDSYAVSQ